MDAARRTGIDIGHIHGGYGDCDKRCEWRVWGAGSSYPSSRADLHSELINKGYNAPTTSGNGYVTYKHPNGNAVTIKPTGEVIPTVRLLVDPTNSVWNAPKYNQRTFYDGTYTDFRSAGHFVEPFKP